ncbi:MAG: tRNA threonylcarbamoyladenosine dehydratase [Puniceicoccales bacterium]|jgi:tRNA A37 threonylcarbamoyladenosine dehydratase|nr:tRNA threonylcarbamoyladenosine dehydratase [Puniceicoccales bacterium]
MNSDFLARYAGTGRLYGRAGLQRLAVAHVAVVGLGGVGSWAAEALARSGVGALTLIDMDDVCISNTNRQLHTTTGTLGQPKVEALRERLQSINPDCRICTDRRFYTAATATDIFSRLPAHARIVDATDGLAGKCHLIAECRARRIPIVVSGGCAGKRDGTAIRVTDLSVTQNDPLLKFVRKRLRQTHGFPRNGKKFGIPCAWSPEPSAGDPDGCSATLAGTLEATDNLRPNCEWGYGTAAFVTGAFGLATAGVVVNAIATGA